MLSQPAPVVVPPAVMAAQQKAPVTKTQTLQAPQAAGKADNTRNSQTSTQTGQSLDTMAGAVNAAANRAGYGHRSRGTLIDVRV